MKRCLGLLILVILSACGSRPCRVAANIPPPPCKAEGTDSEGWRIASGFCQELEGTGAEVRRASVDGTHLFLEFSPAFGQKLLEGESALTQSIGEFLSRMQKETAADKVSVEILSGEKAIARGEIATGQAPRIRIVD